MTTSKTPARLRLAPAALLLALVVVLAVVAAAVGFRLELWGYGSAVRILRYAVYGGIVTALLAVTAMALTWPGRGRRFAVALLALLLVSPALLVPLYWNYSKSRLPPIQDIATDPDDPLSFWDVPTTRIDYPGGEVAEQQRAAFPDIRPLVLRAPLPEVYRSAVELVRERGWKLVAADAEEGRIEATVTTFWFGFKDDVAVGLTPVDGGVRVDMRSASRYGGGGDGGANANRIRSFLRDLQRATGGS
ncbi:MAG TPA: DUF1499 domain-containing protein [Sedimenticola thiotaurini]|uniref:DUF1499 domain-containing protein n=1 Tax=Sedimenticola thiotaurini TaxID=1543721 RepID=A0A831RMD2_9GAMM|nr:DUF1499 domain-containing protein [Sedimenticola thiotaurini]